MRIPLDHFSSVPVFALSPQSPASPEPETSLASTIRDKMSSLTPDLSMFYSASTAGSAPSSPLTSKRKMASVTSSPGQRPASACPGAMMTSLPMVSSAPMSRCMQLLLTSPRPSSRPSQIQKG